MRYILAHDLGTTGNKATLYDADGRLAGAVFHAYQTDYPENGWAEQSADGWWLAVCDSTRQLLYKTAINPADVACLTFSGQMQGCVPVDRQARPLRSAIIWMDQRAAAQASTLAESVSVLEVYRITGHRLSPGYTLSKILWIRDRQPELYAQTYKFMGAKDAIVARLTGRFVTEPSEASGTNAFDLIAGEWSARIIDAAGLDRAKLPDLIASTDVAGGILPLLAAEIGLPAGTPVVIGGGDGACASVGAGSVAPGVAYSYIGSSAWIATAAAAPVIDATMRVFTFGHVVPGLFIPMGTMQTAGAAYQWARDQVALTAAERESLEAEGANPFESMNRLAESSPPGANDLIFLPHLAGERAPRWNPDARAAFIGLSIRHNRADMLRAVLEGVACNLRLILDILTVQAGALDSIRVIGGGSSGRLWAQIMADVYGVPLHRLAVLEEATSMGAAVIGGVGIGLYPGFGIAAQMNPAVETIAPNPAHRAAYDRLISVFDDSYRALEPIFARLAGNGL